MLQKIQAYDCPCCGNTIGEAAKIDMVLERVSRGQQKTILELLARRVGRVVAKSSVISTLFDERSDGGPEGIDMLINTQISNLRKSISRHGWSIVTTGGGRGSETFYRLVPTEVGA